MWGTRGRSSSYAGVVAQDTQRQVAQIRALLEAELDRRVQPYWGCWPLLVGVLGVLLGIALLYESF